MSRFNSDLSHFSRGLLPRALFGFLLVFSYPSPTRVLEGDQTSPWSTVLALVRGGHAVYGTPEAFAKQGWISEISKFGYSDRVLTQLLSSAYATTRMQVETALKSLHLTIEDFSPWNKVWTAQYNTMIRALHGHYRGVYHSGSILGALIKPVEKLTRSGPMKITLDLRENRSNRIPIFSWQIVLLHAGERIVEIRRDWTAWTLVHKDLVNRERELAHRTLDIPSFGEDMAYLNGISRQMPSPWQYQVVDSDLTYSTSLSELTRHCLFSWGQRKLPLPSNPGSIEKISTAWEEPARVSFNDGLFFRYLPVLGYSLGYYKSFPLGRALSPAEFERKNAALATSVSIPFRLLEAQCQDIGVAVEERFHHSDLAKVDGEWFARTTFPWAGK